MGGSLCCSRVLANAGNVVMMLRAVGWGSCARDCSGWWDLRGASRGMAVCAVNQIGDDGAASLAPSLLRMAQLTSLDLSGTLCAWAAAVLFADACERRLCMDGVCCGLGGCARGCSGRWGLRGASRGAAGACSQSDRSRWGSVAGTESRKDGAADVAGPQRYAACIGWACAVRGCLRTPMWW